MQSAVKQAILAMRERYYDAINLHEIAAEVFVSPFHFSRIFSRDTGVTPGKYLTSVRLFEAKRMLLTTSLTVSDIVCSVGYSSVGTFTTRFTQAVGMTPTQYRDPQVRELLVAASFDFHQIPSLAELRRAGQTCVGVRPAHGGAINGMVQVPPELASANVLVGVFDTRIPQCGPVEFTALSGSKSAEITMNNVPEGQWTVIAVAESAGGGAEPGDVYLATSRQPVTVIPGRISNVSLRLRKVQPTDPPIAITLASGTSVAGAASSTSTSRRPRLRAVA